MTIHSTQEETILGLVNEIFLSKRFVDFCGSPILPTDIILGELTDYEKAIYSAMTEVGNKYNELCDKVKKGELEIDQEQYVLLTKTIDAYTLLLWTCFLVRIGRKFSSFDNLVVRDGWKVVGVYGDIVGLQELEALTPPVSDQSNQPRSYLGDPLGTASDVLN